MTLICEFFFTFQVVILDHLDLTNGNFNDKKKLFTITDGFAPHAAAYIEHLNQITERQGQKLKYKCNCIIVQK